MDNDTNAPQIAGLSTRFLKTNGSLSYVAHLDNDVVHNHYLLFIRKEGKNTVVGSFYINNIEKFCLVCGSFERAKVCCLSAANAYLKLNLKAKKRRAVRRAEKKEGK